MKLSIITVNLNNRDGLQKTIDSVVSQTFKDFEWIVIDGGSKDGSRELIEQYADHFAYWVSEPDKGIYNAMNKGIKVAKGEYLQFLNSGDWYWCTDALNKAFAKDLNADIAYADCNMIKGDIVVEERHYPNIMSLKEIIEYNICHNSTIFRKQLFHDTLYDENLRIMADFKFLLKSVLDNRKLVHIPVTLIGYDISGISSTNHELLDKEKEQIIDNFISPSIQKDFQNIDHLNALHKDRVLESVRYYREHDKLYHKLITFSLIAMNLFNKIRNNHAKNICHNTCI